MESEESRQSEGCSIPLLEQSIINRSDQSQDWEDLSAKGDKMKSTNNLINYDEKEAQEFLEELEESLLECLIEIRSTKREGVKK